MNILIACEESQRITMEMRKKGHECYSCDIEDPSGGHPEWHIKGDVVPYINGNCSFTTMDGTSHIIDGEWDLLIAHPPCTYLSVAGNRWFNIEKYGDKARERWKKREEAYDFFMLFINAKCDHICVENPVSYINSHYRKPDQIIHPWQFGHEESKPTCLWLKGLPLLVPTDIKNKIQHKCRDMPDTKNRAKLRSKTYEGIARAIAEQWG